MLTFLTGLFSLQIFHRFVIELDKTCSVLTGNRLVFRWKVLWNVDFMSGNYQILLYPRQLQREVCMKQISFVDLLRIKRILMRKIHSCLKPIEKGALCAKIQSML